MAANVVFSMPPLAFLDGVSREAVDIKVSVVSGTEGGKKPRLDPCAAPYAPHTPHTPHKIAAHFHPIHFVHSQKISFLHEKVSIRNAFDNPSDWL